MISEAIPISVVVNTTDRANSLRTLLHALEQQSYSNFEVVVVVGPTKDNTLDVLQPYQDRLQILHCAKPNLAQSRNIGLLAARGEIVAYVDDDAVPSYHWLTQIAQRFENEKLAGTGGIVYLVHPNFPVVQHRIGITSALAEQADVRQSWLDKLVPEPPNLARHWVSRMMGTNMAFRRKDLLEIAGFDEYYEWVYDDTDIAMRLANAGKWVEPVTQAPIYHVPASSRNRKAFTSVGRWWIRTKAAVYFTLKNGFESGELEKEIHRRCLYLVHGHWLWIGQIYRLRQISLSQFLYLRFQDVSSFICGVWSGKFHERKLVPVTAINDALSQPIKIKPFQNESSLYQPTIDPVQGRQANIQMPESPLRICLLSSAYPPDQYEGVGRMTNLMARGLFELGHSVHVVTRGQRAQTSFYDGAYVHRITPSLTRYEQYQTLPTLYHTLNHSHAVYEKTRQLVLNDGIQIVDSPLWQLDGLVTARAAELPVVVRPQTALLQVAQIQKMRNDDVFLVGELERAFLQQASFVAANSRANFRALQEVYHLEMDEIDHSIIYIGTEAVAEQAVRPFNLEQPPTLLTILYVGRLEKRKGILDLFEAIPKIIAGKSNIRFIIAGDDNSLSDGFQARKGETYVDYFKKNFSQCANQVSFLGHVDETELQKLYQSCDLFVAPSLYESFGQIYLEAMNYGKPVIGCRAGGVPEVVDEGVTGLLVDPESPTQLADAILQLLRSPQKLHEMGVAGRLRLLQKFTHLEMARNFAQIYRTVIQKSQK